MLTFKLAFRSLLRNRWRSSLTLGGVAVATLILVWMSAFTDAFIGVMVNSATAISSGQIQIHNEAYAERASLDEFFPQPDAMMKKIRAIDGVEATPRIYIAGLLGKDESSAPAMLTGVDVKHERSVTRLADGLFEGAWLSGAPPVESTPPANDPDALSVLVYEVVLGEQVAKLLEAKVGDELVAAFGGALGSAGGARLVLKGILRTGNQEVDRLGAYMAIGDLQHLGNLYESVHEVKIGTKNIHDADEKAAQIREIIAADTAALYEGSGIKKKFQRPLVVRTWKQVNPEMSQMLETSSQSIWVIYILIYAVAALGLLNTQRMSAIERQREFGVLLAVGMAPSRLSATLLLEAVLLALAGGLVGATLGASLGLYHSYVGLNMGAMSSSGGGFSYMGVSFGDRVYFDLGINHVLKPVLVLIPIAALCGLWPAISALRLNAIQAISGRS